MAWVRPHGDRALEQARSSNEKAEVGLEAADQVISRMPDDPRALYQWALSLNLVQLWFTMEL